MRAGEEVATCKAATRILELAIQLIAKQNMCVDRREATVATAHSTLLELTFNILHHYRHSTLFIIIHPLVVF